MINTRTTNQERIRLFREAAEKHQQLYRDSMNGKGIDRHLFALYIVSKGMGYVRCRILKLKLKVKLMHTVHNIRTANFLKKF